MTEKQVTFAEIEVESKYHKNKNIVQSLSEDTWWMQWIFTSSRLSPKVPTNFSYPMIPPTL